MGDQGMLGVGERGKCLEQLDKALGAGKAEGEA